MWKSLFGGDHADRDAEASRGSPRDPLRRASQADAEAFLAAAGNLLNEPLLPSSPPEPTAAVAAGQTDDDDGDDDEEAAKGEEDEIVEATKVQVVEASEAAVVEVADEEVQTLVSPFDNPQMQQVSVISPANLPEGYSFVATLPGSQRAFQVVVPPGGVMEGQTFLVPYPAGFLATTVIPPSGHWKDGLFDCCAFGICHPSLLNSVWCPLVGIGQIMTRLQLTWCGTPAASLDQVRNTFTVLLVLTVAWWLGVPIPGFGTLLGLFLVILVARTRYWVRSRYDIAEEHCGGCEDCCCALWCHCCVISQMARHTADYHSYQGKCCSANGLEATAPHVV